MARKHATEAELTQKYQNKPHYYENQQQLSNDNLFTFDMVGDRLKINRQTVISKCKRLGISFQHVTLGKHRNLTRVITSHDIEVINQSQIVYKTHLNAQNHNYLTQKQFRLNNHASQQFAEKFFNDNKQYQQEIHIGSASSPITKAIYINDDNRKLLELSLNQNTPMQFKNVEEAFKYGYVTAKYIAHSWDISVQESTEIIHNCYLSVKVQLGKNKPTTMIKNTDADRVVESYFDDLNESENIKNEKSDIKRELLEQKLRRQNNLSETSIDTLLNSNSEILSLTETDYIDAIFDLTHSTVPYTDILKMQDKFNDIAHSLHIMDYASNTSDIRPIIYVINELVSGKKLEDIKFPISEFPFGPFKLSK